MIKVITTNFYTSGQVFSTDKIKTCQNTLQRGQKASDIAVNTIILTFLTKCEGIGRIRRRNIHPRIDSKYVYAYNKSADVFKKADRLQSQSNERLHETLWSGLCALDKV